MTSNTIRHFTLSKNSIDFSNVTLKDIKLKRKILTMMSESIEVTVNEISESLGISTPKTALLLNELVVEKLIMEIGKRTAGPGRKAILYTLRHDNCYFLGVEIKKYKMKLKK